MSTECSICLDNLELAVCLPCEHQYCLCCIKTYQLSNRGATCPQCRATIPRHFLESLGQDLSAHFQPDVVYTRWAYRSVSNPDEWWLYDAATNKIIEEAYNPSVWSNSVTLAIMGDMYTIDFKNGVQISSDGKRVRHVKRVVATGRDIWSQGVVGIAGIKHVY